MRVGGKMPEQYLPRYVSERIKYVSYQSIKEMFYKKIESQHLERYGDSTVADYLQVLDDYYRFQFERYMSENTLRVFGVVKHIMRCARKDPISWKEIFVLYVSPYQFRNLNRQQFVKGLDALKAMNLISYEIVEINQPTERYIIHLIDISDVVLKVLRTAVKFGYNSKEYLCGIGLLVPHKKSAKSKTKVVDSNLEFKTKFQGLSKKCQTAFEKFFTYLGSFNDTGKIQVSRKLQILSQTLEYVDKGVSWDDVLYSIKQTMSKTKDGGNKFKERYYYAILRNTDIENSEHNEPTSNSVQENVGKQIKIKSKNFEYVLYDVGKDLSEEIKGDLIEVAKTIPLAYYEILKSLADWQNKGDNYTMLISFCEKLNKRHTAHLDNEENDSKRKRFLQDKYNITEKILIDFYYKRHIYWFKDNRQLKSECVLKVLQRYMDTFLENDVFGVRWSAKYESEFLMVGD